ncbi:hypothetical protein COCNU_scaffold020322G000010 [Cocos nucifera]|nr:hypothetical protein [Cocos nucifera]
MEDWVTSSVRRSTAFRRSTNDSRRNPTSKADPLPPEPLRENWRCDPKDAPPPIDRNVQKKNRPWVVPFWNFTARRCDPEDTPPPTSGNVQWAHGKVVEDRVQWALMAPVRINRSVFNKLREDDGVRDSRVGVEWTTGGG